jgi:hypothetical protein
MEFWRGPEGAPKDFSIGDMAIEAKAKRGSSRPYIRISSESQLDDQTVRALYLSVTYVDEGAPEIHGSQSLSDYVRHISSIIDSQDAGSIGFLEARLCEAGYDPDHDYSDNLWIIGNTRWFKVSDEFPRLAKSEISPAIEKVEYNVDISSCDTWETDLADVRRHIGEDTT